MPRIEGTEDFRSYELRLESALGKVRRYLGQGDYVFNSGHEGHAIIRQHMDNLWLIIKSNDGAEDLAGRVALFIVASAVCYMVHVVKGNDMHWANILAETTRDDRVQIALYDIKDELLKARRKFPPFSSAPEGYAVLLEEFEELWDEVKGDTGATEDGYAEAKQVGAMALSYMLDCVKREPVLSASLTK